MVGLGILVGLIGLMVMGLVVLTGLVGLAGLVLGSSPDLKLSL